VGKIPRKAGALVKWNLQPERQKGSRVAALPRGSAPRSGRGGCRFTGCVTETPPERGAEPRTGTPPCVRSMLELDRTPRLRRTRLISHACHRRAYPRHRIWLQRRRDRPGDFSIKSTKVQSFDDAITGTKRPQSLNSANRANGIGNARSLESSPQTAEQEALLSTTPIAVTAGLDSGSKHSPAGVSYAAAGVGWHRDICQWGNQRTTFYAPH
jgi:hypothetical protein